MSKERSKDKFFATLSKWDKANNRFGFYVSIEKKEVDGVESTVMSCDISNMEPVCCTSDSKTIPKAPLKKEFTSKLEFFDYLKNVIESTEDQL